MNECELDDAYPWAAEGASRQTRWSSADRPRPKVTQHTFTHIHNTSFCQQKFSFAVTWVTFISFVLGQQFSYWSNGCFICSHNWVRIQLFKLFINTSYFSYACVMSSLPILCETNILYFNHVLDEFWWLKAINDWELIDHGRNGFCHRSILKQ